MESRPRWIAALDVAFVAAFAMAAVILLVRLGGVPPAGWWPAILASALVGVAAADAATGLVHWFGDTFLNEETPLLGPVLIQPFREHHRDPLAITRHGFFEVSGNNAGALAPLLALAAAGPAPAYGSSLVATLGVSALLAFAVAAVATNAIHRMAHMPRSRVPGLVSWLQHHGMILSPAAHARHHRAAHDRAFGVTTGWTNPLLDRMAFHARLARMLRRLAPHARQRRLEAPQAPGVRSFR
jgi:ubiquitin-conjugating enzyme E2 variant